MQTRSRSLAATALAAIILGASACSDSPTASPTLPSSGIVGGDRLFPSKAAPQLPVAQYEIGYMKFSIDHHLGGLPMASLCLARALHEQLLQLCQTSLTSQRQEIAQLRTWLEEWYGITYMGDIPLSARRDIRRLAALNGRPFENAFLTVLSMHHMQIIAESEKAVATVYHDPLRALAQMIVTNQSRQVVQMQSWDCQWYGDCRQGSVARVEH